MAIHFPSLVLKVSWEYAAICPLGGGALKPVLGKGALVFQNTVAEVDLTASLSGTVAWRGAATMKGTRTGTSSLAWAQTALGCFVLAILSG